DSLIQLKPSQKHILTSATNGFSSGSRCMVDSFSSAMTDDREYRTVNVSRFSSADLFCLTITLIWGANMSLTKDALTEFTPMGFNGLRMLLAGLLLLGATGLLAGKIQVELRDLKKMVALGLIGNTIYQIFFIHGLDLTKAGNVGLLLSSGTIFTALLSHFLKHEVLKKIVWVGIALSMTGVILILTESSDLSFGGGTLKGDLMILMAAACWSVYTVYSKPLLAHYSPLQLTAYTIFSGSVFLFLISLPWVATEPYRSISLRAYLELAYSFTFAIAVAYVFWFLAVDKIG